MSCYHPTRTYTDEQVTDFCDNIAQMIKKIPKSYLIIIGTDINAAIGTPQPQFNNNILWQQKQNRHLDPPCHEKTISTWSPSHFKSTFQTHIQSQKKRRWHKQRQHDNCNQIKPEQHNAQKKENSNQKKGNNENWQYTALTSKCILIQKSSKGDNYEPAKARSECTRLAKRIWKTSSTSSFPIQGNRKEVPSRLFTQSLIMLSLHIHLRNRAFESFIEKKTEEAQNKLEEMRMNLQWVKSIAKWKWQEENMNKCKPENFKKSLREAWQMIFELRDGFQTHHREYGGQWFKNQKWKIANDKSENAKHIKEYYRTIFNRNLVVDPSILNDLAQFPINVNMGNAPTIQEVRNAIQKWRMTKHLDDLS